MCHVKEIRRMDDNYFYVCIYSCICVYVCGGVDNYSFLFLKIHIMFSYIQICKFLFTFERQ